MKVPDVWSDKKTTTQARSEKENDAMARKKSEANEIVTDKAK